MKIKYLFFLLLLFIIPVNGDTAINFLSKGQADTLYCGIGNCGSGSGGDNSTFMRLDGANLPTSASGTILYFNGSQYVALDRPTLGGNYKLSITSSTFPAWASDSPALPPSWSTVLSSGRTSGGTNPQLTTTDHLEFRTTGNYIYSPATTVLDIVASSQVNIKANVNISGTLTSLGNATIPNICYANGTNCKTPWVNFSETPMGEAHLYNNTQITVIPAVGAWIPANGSWVANSNNMYIQANSSGHIKYIGQYPNFFHIAATLSASSAGANDILEAAVFKNDILFPNGLVEFKLGGAGDIGSTAIHVAYLLEYGDVIQLKIRNEVDADDFTVRYANMFLMGMPLGFNLSMNITNKNPFNQVLNTTSSVEFANINITGNTYTTGCIEDTMELCFMDNDAPPNGGYMTWTGNVNLYADHGYRLSYNYTALSFKVGNMEFANTCSKVQQYSLMLNGVNISDVLMPNSGFDDYNISTTFSNTSLEKGNILSAYAGTYTCSTAPIDAYVCITMRRKC